MSQGTKLFSRDYQPDPSRRVRGPVKTRSAITSGTRSFDGVDARSRHGRRFNDLCRAYEKEAGGSLSVTGKTLVRQAATLSLRCELMQAEMLRGRKVKIDDLVRMSSEVRRILAAVGIKTAAMKPAAETLDQYLARTYPAKPEQPADAEEAGP
jgi:hypothetical protein